MISQTDAASDEKVWERYMLRKKGRGERREKKKGNRGRKRRDGKR